MDWILFVWAPLVLGALWGAWQGRRDRFSFSVLLVAPIFSAVLFVGAMMAVGILSGALVNPNNPEPLVLKLLTLLVTTFAYGFGFFVLGAVPALLGSAAGQLGKFWVVHRDSSIRRMGRGESERGDIRDIQAEPGPAEDRPRD